MQGSDKDRTPHDAAGAAAGFLFQLERAFYWLAESVNPDAIIGVETLADIIVSNPAGPSIHEEDKHSIQQQGHPFGDRDKRLWRTLEIWCDATHNGTHQERDARLLLVSNRPVSDGLARHLDAAHNSTDAQLCIQEMRLIAESPPQGIAKIVRTVMDYGDALLTNVIQRIELWDAGASTAAGELRKKTIGRLHLAPSLDGDTVAQTLAGWIQDVLMAKWRSGKPGWISRRAFDTRLHGILHDMKRDRILARAARYIRVEPEERDAARHRRFVQHLAQIAVGDEELDSAIDDYLRFGIESLRLLERGEILKPHWEDRADQLQERWRSISRRARRRANQQPPEQLGQDILERTLDPNFTASLAGNDQPEAYLTHGHYHRIADEDRVWWYPSDRPDY